jgi:adenine-specific DNA-methyltransferase
MASLAEREGLRGKVQCIYIDPPYGIRFNSNWQVSTLSRDVKDGKQQDVSREPEQIKAFRDTWKDGIHCYLTYLRDRLTVARELLTESGSIFVQIGDENLHRVRALMDEVFGVENFVNSISFVTTGGQSNIGLAKVCDFVVWYARSWKQLKHRELYEFKSLRSGGGWAHSRAKFPDATKQNLGRDEIKRLFEPGADIDPYYQDNLVSQGSTPAGSNPFTFQGRAFKPPSHSHWNTHAIGMERLSRADRIDQSENSIRYVRLYTDLRTEPLNRLVRHSSCRIY